MPKWLVVAVRDIPRITNQLKYLKMTKEEKIQDVYEKLGFEWNVCSNYITENGVLILPTPDLKYSLKGYENLVKDENKFSAFGKEGLKLQPTELSGIYNNNGQIKIETIEDLPIEEGTFEVHFKTDYGAGFRTEIFTGRLSNSIHHITGNPIFSHYKKYIKSAPPVF